MLVFAAPLRLSHRHCRNVHGLHQNIFKLISSRFSSKIPPSQKAQQGQQGQQGQQLPVITRLEPKVAHLPSSPAFSRVLHVQSASSLVYISGTGAGNDIGGPAREGTATEETRWSLENLAQLLEASNSGMDQIVSVTMLLTNKEDYDEINTEYLKHFPTGLPSRSTALWGVPTTAKVAFSCVALGSIKHNK